MYMYRCMHTYRYKYMYRYEYRYMYMYNRRSSQPTKETLPTKVTATLPAARRTLAQPACQQAHGHEPRMATQDIQLARPQRAR
jgi:hypothetical protein